MDTFLCPKYGKFTPEMRSPLYTGHQVPKVSIIKGFHCIRDLNLQTPCMSMVLIKTLSLLIITSLLNNNSLTHWKQDLLMVDTPLTVKPDDIIEGRIKIARNQHWRRHLKVLLTYRHISGEQSSQVGL